MNQDPILQKAMNKWENMSHDSSFPLAYEAHEKLLLDEQAKLAHAREEGVEQGKIQLIRCIHKNGMPVEDIVKFTGLSTKKYENYYHMHVITKALRKIPQSFLLLHPHSFFLKGLNILCI